MTMKTMGKRLQAIEAKQAPRELGPLRIVGDGPETDAMIAASRAWGDNTEFLVLVGVEPQERPEDD